MLELPAEYWETENWAIEQLLYDYESLCDLYGVEPKDLSLEQLNKVDDERELFYEAHYDVANGILMLTGNEPNDYQSLPVSKTEFFIELMTSEKHEDCRDVSFFAEWK